MISPKAIHLLIKHFDSIDAAVSKKMVTKRPWQETALTSLLCDLLDAEVQLDEKLSYPLDSLNRDLFDGDGLIQASFSVQTHEYTPDLERWITQSDLGLIINFRDYLLPEESWSTGVLLQAKRLTPYLHDEHRYSERSRFGGVDAAQQQRIVDLRKVVDVNFIKYLLYCPRPSLLDEITRKKLARLRLQALGQNIFDFALGLELRDDIQSQEPTVAAGLFISEIAHLPDDFGSLHQSIFNGCWPFSWFLLTHFSAGIDHPRNHLPEPSIQISPDHIQHRSGRKGPQDNIEWAHGIIRGDREAIERLLQALEVEENKEFRFLPAHTISIDITVGEGLNPEEREIILLRNL